jgi:hypothetical protein
MTLENSAIWRRKQKAGVKQKQTLELYSGGPLFKLPNYGTTPVIP